MEFGEYLDPPAKPYDCRMCGNTNETHTHLGRLVEGKLCFNCDFWDQYAKRVDDPRCVRVNGTHYVIAADEPDGMFRGFGGQGFTVQFFDGRTVATSNLWHQGTIPELFRDRLPDNAKFMAQG